MDNSNALPLGSAAVPVKEKTTASRIKSIFSGSVGNMVEWYDWYVYAAFSLYFAKTFFPAGSTTAQLMNTAAIFAVGFLMRPIGGWLMGLYADRKGRKAALMASVLLMCFGSLIIALTPGYETIGVGAPILLVLARLMQGLSVGGEYGTSATYLSEMATKERRGFFSSFQYVTLIGGQLLAVSVLLLLAWSTEGKLHPFDTTTTTYAGLVILLLPRVGIMTWKDVQSRIPWGTVIVFGVGISLGSALLSTHAGQWLGGQVVAHTGLDQVGPLAVFAILAAFLILIHLGFASATALTSALLPILIAVLQTLPGEFSRLGMTMLLGFVVSYGFILPINAPQNMVCLGTETFNARQFAKVGLLVTLIGYLLMLVFAMTWWKWLGWM